MMDDRWWMVVSLPHPSSLIALIRSIQQAGGDGSLAEDRLSARRAGGHDRRGNAGQLFETRDVAPRLLRQIVVAPHAARRRRPSRHRLVNRFAVGELADFARKFREG